MLRPGFVQAGGGGEDGPNTPPGVLPTQPLQPSPVEAALGFGGITEHGPACVLIVPWWAYLAECWLRGALESPS